MVNLAFPYQLDDRGRTKTASYDDHVEQMLLQLLLTRPGERVNQPELGCGVGDDLFGPNSPELAAALNITISAAIQRWLGDVISLSSLEVTAVESTLTVSLAYVVLATGQATTTTLTVAGPT
ncbi:MAG TPA: GPW/gp25 family protein [Solirubrobacteraceae bacterium]|nr:GPW/gp25 family protein [Solirubrobacteraceae bacterium]